MTEVQPYDVERRYDDFEVRRYPEHHLVEVDVDGDFSTAGNRGFRPLVSYISGSNAEGRQIAMTAPVIQSPTPSGTHTVSFVLPASLDAASVPSPTNPAVRSRAVPPGLVAARTFSGGVSDSRFEENGARLLAAVAREGLAHDGEVYFARYDPPWKPGFLKRNEALVRLTSSL